MPDSSFLPSSLERFLEVTTDREQTIASNLDRESTLLAQSQLQFQMGTQLVKSQFHQLLSAINGGN